MRALIVAVSLLAAAPTIAAAAEAEAPAEQSVTTAKEERAARLDALFAELKAAPSPAVGKAVEHEILVEWMRSGDAEIDKMMSAAILAMNAGELDAAVAVLDQIVALRPDYVEGWNKRATVFYYMHEYDKSLADIDRTLALEPRHFGALAGLGMIMRDVGNLKGAIAAFEQAVAVNPSLENVRAAIEQLRARTGKDI